MGKDLILAIKKTLFKNDLRHFFSEHFFEYLQDAKYEVMSLLCRYFQRTSASLGLQRWYQSISLTPYINHLLRKSFCTEARLLATSHLIRTTTFSKKVENADKKVYWPKTKLMSISSDNAIRSLSLMECVRSSTYFEFLDRASDDPVDHKITC